jgi:fatty-acyl-CoA synthase
VLLDTDGRARPGCVTVAGLAALGDENRGASTGLVVDPHVAGDMLYTSGTTGSPKGVLVTHDAVLRTAYASALTRAYGDGRRILFSLPCYHMFGYLEGLLSVMFVGGAIIPLTAFSAEGYFAGIERHRASDILCVPTMVVAMVESAARERYDLGSLNAMLCGSAPAPIWLWRRIEEDFGVREIVTGYGMTECGGAMTLTRPEDPLHLTSDTVGMPKMAGAASVPGADALVVYKAVDPQTGEEQGGGSANRRRPAHRRGRRVGVLGADRDAGVLEPARGDRGDLTGWMGLLRGPRPGSRRRLSPADRPEQGAVQERRRAGDAQGDRGSAGGA